jgi:hypothetical protein
LKQKVFLSSERAERGKVKRFPETVRGLVNKIQKGVAIPLPLEYGEAGRKERRANRKGKRG